jgi:hypothetical protein
LLDSNGFVPNGLLLAGGFIVLCLAGPLIVNEILLPLVGKLVFRDKQPVMSELVCTLGYYLAIGYLIVWATEFRFKIREINRGVGSVGATVVGVAVGLAMASVWMRTTDSYQVALSLLVAFGVGAVFARLCFPGVSLRCVLAIPLWAGALSYAVSAVAYPSADKAMAALFLPDGPFVWRSSLALPIFYASAGVAGATMGWGWVSAASIDGEPAESGQKSANSDIDAVDAKAG